jgi:hypothetical protein
MAVMPPIGMMIILQYVRDAMHFDPWQGPGEKSFAFFCCVDGADAPGIPPRSFGLEPNGKNRMKQFLKMTSAMLALALS